MTSTKEKEKRSDRAVTVIAVAAVVLACVIGAATGEALGGVLIAFLFAVLALIVVTRVINGKSQSLGDMRASAFYAMCLEKGIKSLNSQKDKAKAAIIAKQVWHTDVETGDLARLFEKGKQVSEAKQEANRAQAEVDRIAALKEEEAARYQQLTQYADLPGNTKTTEILKERIAELRKSIRLLKNTTKITSDATLEKEHDWAIMGGIASGLAGGAAGLATAIDTQAENAAIRARNAQKKKEIEEIGGKMERYASVDLTRELKEYQSALDKESVKLVAEMEPLDVLSHLKFGKCKVDISDTGAFTVSVPVTMPDELIIYEDLPARIDGTVIANVFQNGKKIGQADMVFPLYGIKHGGKVTLTGMALSGAGPDAPCKVDITATHLYAIED